MRALSRFVPIPQLRPVAMLLAASLPVASLCASPSDPPWQPVAGSGVHRFSSALIHSQEPTPTGFIQRSTDTVEVTGDLQGRILYHPVSEFDFAAGTLVNTGDQVFSGTVLGSVPVLLHDDRFRFVVELATGATVGEVYLEDRIDGRGTVRCRLDVVGTGLDALGDATFDYTGRCRFAPGLQVPASQ